MSVTVTLNGRSYRLQCGDGEEARLLELAAYLRDKIDDLSREIGVSGDERLLVMAALIVADELFDARARLAASQAPAEAYPVPPLEPADSIVPVGSPEGPISDFEPPAPEPEGTGEAVAAAEEPPAPGPEPTPERLEPEPAAPAEASQRRPSRRAPGGRPSLEERLAMARAGHGGPARGNGGT